MEDNTFWLIWSENGNPTKRHNEWTEVNEEAKRLATKHIGTKFYVGLMTEVYLANAEVERKALLYGN
jgi:hypothetical protein